MTDEIEIEKKNLLTKEEYDLVYNHFNLKSQQVFTQTNAYFDTKDLAIRKTDSALRIRTKVNFSEMTLKTPYKENLLEINLPLGLDKAEELIKQQSFKPTDDILSKLIDLGIDKDITVYLLTKLTTKRIEKKLNKGLLVLDQSWYGNTTDYELEIEADSNENAEDLFSEILSNLTIPHRKTENKIQRAINSLYQ